MPDGVGRVESLLAALVVVATLSALRLWPWTTTVSNVFSLQAITAATYGAAMPNRRKT
jgi:hypothetical protein